MLAVAAQLDPVARLLAVFAAVLPIRPVWWHHARTCWMRAFHFYSSHSAPLPQQSTPVTWRLQVRCLGWWLICAVVLSVVGSAPHAAEQSTSSEPLDDTLRNVGRRIQDWYSRAQTVVSTETVWIQPLRADMSPDAFPRRLAFELRVEWDPERFGSFGLPAASVLREVLSINGRAPEGIAIRAVWIRSRCHRKRWRSCCRNGCPNRSSRLPARRDSVAGPQ